MSSYFQVSVHQKSVLVHDTRINIKYWISCITTALVKKVVQSALF